MIGCPFCRHPHTFVVDSRSNKAIPDSIKRRRQCNNCGRRFNTVEVTQLKYKQILAAELNSITPSK